MEIKGKVIAKPASESGTSSRGFWKKAFLVIRYEEGQFPRDVLLSSIKKADEMERVREGQTGTFKFDARTRQAQNGRWYCDLELWALDLDQQQTASSQVDPF